jgi:hypothetical protein
MRYFMKKPEDVREGDLVYIHLLASKLPARVIKLSATLKDVALIQRNGFDQWIAYSPRGQWQNMDGDLVSFA